MKLLTRVLPFKRQLKGPIGPLELLVLQPTPFCNINCDCCYLPNRTSTKRMSFETLEKIFQEVFQSGLVKDKFNVLWHAGEPMAVGLSYYEEALRIIESLLPPGVELTYTFQTNGTLINEAWCQFFKKHPFRIGVSIDGPEDVHDAHRKFRNGKGTHKKTMEGIYLLKQHQIPFSTISVLTKEVLDKPKEFYDFFSKLGTTLVGLNVEEKEGANATSTLEGQGIEEKFSQFVSRLYDFNSLNPEPLSFREFQRFETSILGFRRDPPDVTSYRGGQDNTAFRILNIDWEGNFSTYSPELLGMDVKPYGKFVLGNILTDKISTVIQGELFNNIQAAILRGMKTCEKKCPYFSLCGGGSPANKYYENGSFESTETLHCRLHTKVILDVTLKKLEQQVGIAQ